MLFLDTDETPFEEVQFNVVLLALANTFSRTECPCIVTKQFRKRRRHMSVVVRAREYKYRLQMSSFQRARRPLHCVHPRW
jgi:hypothetical protein